MKKATWLFLTMGTLVSCQQKQQTPGTGITIPEYPSAQRDTTADNYFGTQIADPYRWMENDTSQQVTDWVNAEDSVTNHYLSQIPDREKIRDRLSTLWNYPRKSTPFLKGGYYYYFRNDGLQNQSILYRRRGLNGSEEKFMDPNKLSSDGTAALEGYSFSPDGKYMAYSIGLSGSDWHTGFVMETASGKVLPDTIRWIKFTGFSWWGDRGFDYSGYDKPDEKTMLTTRNEFEKVYFHRLGTPQTSDELVFQDKSHPLRYFDAELTEDNRFLILSVAEGTSGDELWWKDMRDKGAPLKLLLKGFDYNEGVVDNDSGYLLVMTNRGAPNYRVISIDPRHPDSSRWRTIIPEQHVALQNISTVGGKLFASYLKDACSRVVEYDYKGTLIRDVQLPGIGTADGFAGNHPDSTTFYGFDSFTQPGIIYQYNVNSGLQEVFSRTEVKFNPDSFVTREVFYHSKDGTRVPLFLSFKRGIRLDGNNPVLLYGYGGFDIASTPYFSVSDLFFMEQGGIYALACIRGGSEYGEAWHKAGMFEKKQNVFDDFIGAAEYLIYEKYTNPGKLAIEGGSNGGLLVGACMAQRPDLFRVVIAEAGVMDMLRYQKFTVGWGWATEYGTSDHADQFKYLIKYSPIQNLKKGVVYPATLVTTADHDDRVVPAHSFKFAATLQADQAGSNPVLIRVEKKAGHFHGMPVSKQIAVATDIWAFVMYNLGMEFR